MDTHFQNKTRLEAVKEAICDEIKRMKVEKDDSRIAIITFGSKVSLETVTGSMNIPS
jgi:hypothetical protein